MLSLPNDGRKESTAKEDTYNDLSSSCAMTADLLQVPQSQAAEG
jgi:hypothetical protein